MPRTRYLVAYDIRDPRRLRAICSIVLGYGSRLQYSLFVCDLSVAELNELRFDLRSTLDTRVDSVVIISLGAGYDLSSFEFHGPRHPLPATPSQIY